MTFDILKGKDTGMNGFKIMADSYRKAASDGFTNPEVFERKARVFDILAECDQEDLYTFIDSSAFNDIIRDFMDNPTENGCFSMFSAVSKNKCFSLHFWFMYNRD